MIEPLTLSIADAAKFIGCGRTKTKELIRTKRLKAVLLDHRVKVYTDSCRAYIASLPEYQPVLFNGPERAPAKPAKRPRRKASRKVRP